MKLWLKLLAALASASSLMAGQAAWADVNDFSFESFDAVYELSQNKAFDNRPEIHVTETIVAIFPEIDQNRGIKRSIPSSSYGVYPGLIEIHSVTDENGAARDYEVIEEEGFNNIYIKNGNGDTIFWINTFGIYTLGSIAKIRLNGFNRPIDEMLDTGPCAGNSGVAQCV